MTTVSPITDITAAEIIAEMTVLDTRDLGTDITHTGHHHRLGRCTVIAVSAGWCWLVTERDAIDIDSALAA